MEDSTYLELSEVRKIIDLEKLRLHDKVTYSWSAWVFPTNKFRNVFVIVFEGYRSKKILLNN
jgi:hypothetical protein